MGCDYIIYSTLPPAYFATALSALERRLIHAIGFKLFKLANSDDAGLVVPDCASFAAVDLKRVGVSGWVLMGGRC